MMPLFTHRFAALVAMLAVFGAQAACACHAMKSTAASSSVAVQTAAEPAKDTSPHACCQHVDHTNAQSGSQPQPVKPDGCRHCSGELKAAPSRPADESGGVGAFPLAFLAIPVESALLPTPSAPIELRSDLVTPSSTSLLRLHCALNL